MERMEVFFCREKGLGASRGLETRLGFGFEVWEVSMERSITESLKAEEERGRLYKANCRINTEKYDQQRVDKSGLSRFLKALYLRKSETSLLH